LQLRSDPNTQFSLALCFLKLNEKSRAEAIFKQMLADYGDRAIWHVIIAGAYREANDNDDAAQEFRRAIALDNGIDHAHFFLGLTLLQQNHWAQTDASMAEFRESARLNPKDYNSNFYLGAGEAEFKQFEDSNRHLTLASQEQPDAPEPWLYLGMNAFQQQDFKTAKGYLEKAIATTGADESRNGYQLKRVYIALSRISFTDGERDQAQKYAQKARELQNKSLEVSGQSIAETMQQGGMGDAAAVMPHANLPSNESPASAEVDPTAQVSSNPLKPEEAQQAKALEKRLRQVLSSSFNDWGTAEARQGMFAFALEHFQEAEKWDDSTPGLMRNVALAALKTNNQPEAERALKIGVEHDPTDSRSRAQLAMMLYSDSQYADAAQQFNVLGESAYGDPGMAYAWAYSLVRTKQSKQATTVLDRLAKQSLPPEILLSIGDLYAVIELYEPAIAAYRKAEQQNRDAERVHYKIGAALLRLDRPSEAANELEIEWKRTPGDPDVEYNLAYALLQTSQRDRALTLLRDVVTHHPDHPQAQYELGKAVLEDGHLDDALPHLEAAARLDPGRDYVHYQLQVAYRRLGRTVEADKELNVYREIKAQKRERAVPHSEAQ
jgi:predicted Zn-dependent protease